MDNIVKIGEVRAKGKMVYIPKELGRLLIHRHFGKIPKRIRVRKKRLRVAFNELLWNYLQGLKNEDTSNGRENESQTQEQSESQLS